MWCTLLINVHHYSKPKGGNLILLLFEKTVTSLLSIHTIIRNVTHKYIIVLRYNSDERQLLLSVAKSIAFNCLWCQTVQTEHNMANPMCQVFALSMDISPINTFEPFFLKRLRIPLFHHAMNIFIRDFCDTILLTLICYGQWDSREEDSCPQVTVL